MKYTNFKRYKFSTILKYLNLSKYRFSRFYRDIDFKRYNISKFYRYINFKRYNFNRVYKYLNLKKTKIHLAYFIIIVISLSILYLSIPLFYKYDNLKIANVICKDLGVKCAVEGKINYNLIPSPSIKIKNLIIKNFSDKKEIIGEVKNATIKISFYNLLDKEGFIYKKINLENGNFNFDLKNLNNYKNFFAKEINSIPIFLKNSEINFFEDKEYITSITNVKFKYKSDEKKSESVLKGKIFNDNIYINIINQKAKNQLSKVLTLKLLKAQIFTKVEIYNLKNDKGAITGKALFKKDKNRLTSIFEYKDNQIIFKKSNLRNTFLDGKLEGSIAFSPYFDFDLNIDLNSINFNRLHSYLLTLNKTSKKNLFRVNKKINGKLHLTTENIFSKYTLIDSFESRIKFVNGDILVEQLLLNLGKLGAADITGIVSNDKKFSTFKFENNIFLDNLKRFYNKFGIYNKKKISSNLFIAGNIDLENLNLRLNEISNEKKLSEEDVLFIEKELNDTLLGDGYASLFNFKVLKKFVKLINSEEIN